VDLDGADAEQIIAAVTKCPTGALRYTSGGAAEPAPAPTAMVPIHDGPLLVRGDLRVLDPETGGVIAEETRIALCRCGKSENQPFCDNSHRRTHFTEASHIESSARADATSPADICPPQDFALE
jgi:CDGSH-type Zn-finger protein